MFKSLDKTFEKRKKILSQSKDKNLLIREGLNFFLKNEFNEDIKGFSLLITYDPKNNSLLITAENKVLANELTIRLPKMTDFLKTRDIRLDRILIR